MRDELIRLVQELADRFFGNRTNGLMIRGMGWQVRSMQKNPTHTNIHKQLGDLLFLIVDMAKRNGWTLDQLVQDRVQELRQRIESRHYYESHVTIEPVSQKREEQLKAIAGEHGFHVATLLMQKRPADTPERSMNDSFCTARGMSYTDLEERTLAFVRWLEDAEFVVWRYKIESTTLDSRYDDSLHPLDRGSLPDKERNPRAPADGALAGRTEK